MSREEYLNTLRELLSGDPARIRDANRQLYAAAVVKDSAENHRREADLVLAEVAQQ